MVATFEKGQAVEFFQDDKARKEGAFSTVPNGHPLTVTDIVYENGKPSTVVVRFEKAADAFFERGKEFPMNPTFLRPRAVSNSPTR